MADNWVTDNRSFTVVDRFQCISIIRARMRSSNKLG